MTDVCNCIRFTGTPWYRFSNNEKWKDGGNMLRLSESFETQQINIRNNRRGASGNICSFDDVTAFRLALQFSCITAELLSFADQGALRDIAAVSSAATLNTVAWKNSFVPMDYVDAVVTQVESIPAGTTYTAGTDYIVSGSGLFIPSGSTIPDATLVSGVAQNNITITYTAPAAQAVEALAGAQREIQLLVDGYNKANGKSMRLMYHRVKLALSPLDWITNDGTISINTTAEVLADTTKAVGLSQYRQIIMPPVI